MIKYLFGFEEKTHELAPEYIWEYPKGVISDVDNRSLEGEPWLKIGLAKRDIFYADLINQGWRPYLNPVTDIKSSPLNIVLDCLTDPVHNLENSDIFIGNKAWDDSGREAFQGYCLFVREKQKLLSHES